MNTPSIVKMSVGLLSKDVPHHTLPHKTDTRSTEFKSAEKSVLANGNRSGGTSSSAKPRLQLGEAVRHSRHGVGRVLAHWADGTVQVRFENLAENQLIWPSFLDRVNGQLR
jgi:hypothetical protein